MIKVTYLDHSGFLVELEDAYFLFDYYKGRLPQIDLEKKMFVFVSHAHHDHYRKDIFNLRKHFREIRYVLSTDIEIKAEKDIVQMQPNERKEVMGAEIRTLRSTDEGVAFVVHYAGKTVYHAGDLNWWHWEGEPDEKNTEMRRAYQAEINRLMDEKIDIAFVPVDPRLGEQYCWGIDCFMKRTETKVVFPMHFWGNYSIFNRLALEKCVKDYEDRIVRIEKPGQVFLLDEMDENDRIRVRYSSILQQ